VTAANATVIAAAVGAIGIILGAIISAWLNRDKDDAAVADQVSKAWTPLVSELRIEVQDTRRECSECRTELVKVKKALRAVIRAALVHAPRDASVDAAINDALNVLNDDGGTVP
jgi:hypothetical protein